MADQNTNPPQTIQFDPPSTAPAVGGGAPPQTIQFDQPSTTPTGSPASTELPNSVFGNADTNNVVENLAAGFSKGANKTAEGAIDLLNSGYRKLGGSGDVIPQLPVVRTGENLNTQGAAQGVGEGVENIAEFAAGDEALSGLAKAAKIVELGDKYPLIARTLKLAKEHPILAKIIGEAGKGAVVGGGQGAVKGAAEGKAAGEGVSGAVGGALGGAAGAGIAEGVRPLARILGLGGLTSAEAITKAGRPYVGEQNWEKNLQSVLPRLIEADKIAPVKTVGDFEDLAHDAANNLWKDEIQPQIDRHATETLDTTPIRAQIQSAVTRPMQKYFPEEAAKIEQFANNFSTDTTVAEANEDLQAFNAKLKEYYKASPVNRAAILKTEGDVTALESAASALRDTIYNHLEASGEDIPRELRQQYGALKQVERVFGKRATVADRQAPLNLTQVIGLIAGGGEAATALLSGHPLAAAAGVVPVGIATAAKMRNAPESLIRQGLTAGAREAAGPSVAREAAKSAVPKVGAIAGSTAGRTFFRASDGSLHSVPDNENAIAHARAIDPQLQIIDGPGTTGTPTQ